MESAQQNQGKQVNEYTIAAHRVPDKPLDFSFLQIKKVEQLRKEPARSGARRPPQESDDEEDSKKDTNQNLNNENDLAEAQKELESKEKVIRAPQSSAIAQLMS